MTALRECLRKAVAAVNGPLFTDKSNEQAGWAAVSFLQSHGTELLSILDAEGDGGAVDDDDLPGMWSNADFTGGDPDERCHAERSHEDEMFNTFRLAYYGSNKSLAPSLESFRRAYRAIHPQPARSGVVSDEACIAKAQKIVRDVWGTWYPGNDWTPASSMHDLLCQLGNSLLGLPDFSSVVDSRLHAQNTIDAALKSQGESNV